MGILRFRMFGFPVDVRPGFWILALLISASANASALKIGILIGVIILSVLTHELGHALLARAYGEEPRITLHMMGGLTSWSPRRPPTRGASILITLAGPFAGFALAAVAFGLLALISKSSHSALLMALESLFVVNAFWSVVNLLPVLPFDGGQVMAAALGPKRRKLTVSISLLFGVVVALAFWRAGMLLGAVFFALGALQSFFALRESPRAALPPEAVQELLTRAAAALEAGEHRQAGSLARAALESAGDGASAKRALEIGTWAALLGGDLPAARAALRSLPPDVRLDPLLEAAVLEADGNGAGAAARLGEARRAGDRRPELGAMLVRLLLAENRFEEAIGLTHEIFDDVGEADVRQVAERALAGGAIDPARSLLERLSTRSAGSRA